MNLRCVEIRCLLLSTEQLHTQQGIQMGTRACVWGCTKSNVYRFLWTSSWWWVRRLWSYLLPFCLGIPVGPSGPPRELKGCGKEDLHVESGVRRDNEFTDFPTADLRNWGSPGPRLDCLSKCRLGCLCLPGAGGGVGGNHQTDRALLIWWLECLFLLPLEFVKSPSMGQSSAYRINTMMPGVGVRLGPGQQRSTQCKQAQGLRVCVFAQWWQQCPRKSCLLTVNSSPGEFLLITCHEFGRTLTTVGMADKTV